jgi:hypothetical protein
MTKAQLLALATENGIEIPEGANKTTIFATIDTWLAG